MSGVRSDLIYRALAKKHRKDVFIGQVKTGRTWDAQKGELGILDAVAIKRSWANPCITGYEVKVNRQDFLRDEKWPKYVAYCHRFSFVSPRDIVKPEDLPDGIGLIWYSPERDTLHTKVKSNYRVMDELPTDLLYYIILSRTESDRHPFFSTTREQIEAWLKDKEDRRMFGWEVSKKLAEVKEECRTKTLQMEELKRETEWRKEVVGFLGDRGIRLSRYSWERELAEALSGKMTPAVSRQITALVKSVHELEQLLVEDEPAGQEVERL